MTRTVAQHRRLAFGRVISRPVREQGELAGFAGRPPATPATTGTPAALAASTGSAGCAVRRGRGQRAADRDDRSGAAGRAGRQALHDLAELHGRDAACHDGCPVADQVLSGLTSPMTGRPTATRALSTTVTGPAGTTANGTALPG